ncbi:MULTISPECIES: cytochrome c oxidase subunit II [Pontibacillus]|uniref:Cytochrome aa3 subunit 2 n=1 Tax=Pontibacillus chungwhensis TaxID=265426 RepID=A0ABY8US47_9BACI|nr:MULTISPECIES: cytochrome c oxidase subunit II [Pontibacillus]MCD5322940.1 cytochrome c oxidase subunit II [Pontibacillus sp. HN14]WIF96334.1 cytochrome c oxidase subunit II [Pontibacillus chungwhensis]
MHLHKYEKMWMLIGGGALLIFLIMLGVGAFYQGTKPPSCLTTIDPQNVEAHDSFKTENLGLQKLDDHQYVVNVIASAFNYDFGTDEEGNVVRTIRIPTGSEVMFQGTSKDVVHGFELAGTNANMMLEPGYINTVETTFNKPGTYTFVCNEYCGTGHHYMTATVEVYDE